MLDFLETNARSGGTRGSGRSGMKAYPMGLRLCHCKHCKSPKKRLYRYNYYYYRNSHAYNRPIYISLVGLQTGPAEQGERQMGFPNTVYI